VTAGLIVGPERAWAASFEVRAHQRKDGVYSLSVPPLSWIPSGEGQALGPLTSHLMTAGRLVFDHPLVEPEKLQQIMTILGVSA